MKIISPVNDLIVQTVRLFQELSEIAQNLHGLGPDSGALRTILLHLFQHGETSAFALGNIYPMAAEKGLSLIDDLVRRGLVLRTVVQGRPMLNLTLPGKAFTEQLMQREADFFRKSPVPLPLANIREAAATIEVFLAAIKKTAEQEDQARVVGL